MTVLAAGPGRALPVLVCAVASLLAPARPALAQSTTLDVVDVRVVDRELLGIRDPAPVARERLLPGEEPRWIEARGRVGAVLTDQRFLAVAPNSSGWQAERISTIRDGPGIETALGANVALCITASRVLVFSALAGVLHEFRLGAGERALQHRVREHVAAVATSRRLIGFTSRVVGSGEVPLRAGEQVLSMRALGTSVTVRTSSRLLVFRQSSAAWSAEDL